MSKYRGQWVFDVAMLSVAWASLLFCSVGCTPPNSEVAPPPRHSAECSAGILLAGTPIVGAVTRPPTIADPPLRLVDLPFRTDGPSGQPVRSRVERVAKRSVQRWQIVYTPLGPRRSSAPLATRIDQADTLVLEIAREGVEAVDLTAVPVGHELSAVERLHRTVRLDFPSSAASTHTFEVALQPLLRESWQGKHTASDRFRIEISGELPSSALRRVEVRRRDARFEGAAARRMDGPAGALRPAFHLRSGATLRLSIPASTNRRTLVFHLHAPVGEPTVLVRDSGDRSSMRETPAPQAGWTRHEMTIPAGAPSEVHFEARGSGVALIGDPTVWPVRERSQPPDVVIYMVDTLLASRIGALGNEVADVSPVMDEIIRHGLAFVRATSTSAWTKPAIPSLLAGVYPLTHRIGTRNYTDRMPARAPMLQARFRQAGFRTVSLSASPLGSTLSGLEGGFDLAHPPAEWANALGPLGHPDARQIQASLLAFVEEDPSRPVFAYLHTLDVHEFERPMFAEGADSETPYDRAVRHQDAALGELVEAYQTLRRDLVLVLVSDHGEGFGEYGLKAGHGYSVRQNQLHVPIVFYAPRWLPRGRVAEPASLVDIAPTLLDLFSLAPLPGAQGRSLLPNAEEAPDAVYAERTWFLWEANGATLLARVGADGRKLVTGYQRPVSWRLAESPCEDTAHGAVPDATEQSDLARFVQAQRVAAEWWDSSYGESEPVRIDPDDVARLRALGYLQ